MDVRVAALRLKKTDIDNHPPTNREVVEIGFWQRRYLLLTGRRFRFVFGGRREVWAIFGVYRPFSS